MPKIQEYLPETEAQGPVGAVSPLLEQTAMFGRGIEAAGRDINDAATVLRERKSQAESSDAYAQVAEQRESFMQRIQQQTNDGSLDDKGVEQIKKDYQDWVDKQYDSYDTAAGKDAFVRASSRTAGAILLHASAGQAVAAGNKAKADAGNMVNSMSNVLMNDPSQFPDLHQQSVEYVQSQVESGAVKPDVARQIQTAFDTELAKGALRGHMQNDYAAIKQAVINSGGKVDPNTDKLNTAQAALMAGAFDSFINSDQKHALMQEIKSNQRAAEDAGNMALKKNQELMDAKNQAFKSSAMENIQKGTYDPNDAVKAVQAGVISPKEQDSLNKLQLAQLEKNIGSNPTAKAQLMTRILSPEGTEGHISDISQLADRVATNKAEIYAGSQKISKKDFDDLALQFSMVNGPNRTKESNLISYAQSKFGDTPDGHYKLSQFTNELQKAKDDAIKQNQPLAPLYDRNNKDSFYNKIQDFMSSPQQLLNQQAKKLTNPNQGFDASKLNLQDIKNLNPATLTPAQRNEVRARFKQLGGG